MGQVCVTLHQQQHRRQRYFDRRLPHQQLHLNDHISQVSKRRGYLTVVMNSGIRLSVVLVVLMMMFRTVGQFFRTRFASFSVLFGIVNDVAG